MTIRENTNSKVKGKSNLAVSGAPTSPLSLSLRSVRMQQGMFLTPGSVPGLCGGAVSDRLSEGLLVPVMAGWLPGVQTQRGALRD